MPHGWRIAATRTDVLAASCSGCDWRLLESASHVSRLKTAAHNHVHATGHPVVTTIIEVSHFRRIPTSSNPVAQHFAHGDDPRQLSSEPDGGAA